LSHLPLAQCDGLYHLAGVAILHLTHHLLQRFQPLACRRGGKQGGQAETTVIASR
jgi:hypothetical protein